MKFLESIKRDYLEILPPALFFFVAFSLILITKRLILSEYGISWSGFGAAFVGALMIGKVVLIADKLPFVNRYPDRRLACNAAWKCLIYFMVAFVIQYLERAVPLLTKHRNLLEAHRHFVAETVWPHVLLIQMWLLVLFFVYCALRELVRAIGREKVLRMFFGGESAADKR